MLADRHKNVSDEKIEIMRCAIEIKNDFEVVGDFFSIDMGTNLDHVGNHHGIKH